MCDQLARRHLAQQLGAGHDRHVEVGEDRVDRLGLEHGQRFAAVGGFDQIDATSAPLRCTARLIMARIVAESSTMRMLMDFATLAPSKHQNRLAGGRDLHPPVADRERHGPGGRAADRVGVHHHAVLPQQVPGGQDVALPDRPLDPLPIPVTSAPPTSCTRQRFLSRPY